MWMWACGRAGVSQMVQIMAPPRLSYSVCIYCIMVGLVCELWAYLRRRYSPLCTSRRECRWRRASAISNSVRYTPCVCVCVCVYVCVCVCV